MRMTGEAKVTSVLFGEKDHLVEIGMTRTVGAERDQDSTRCVVKSIVLVKAQGHVSV